MRVIQFGLDASDPREQASIEQLKNLGYTYTRIENPRYEVEPPLDNIFEGNKDLYVGLSKQFHEIGLTPPHYGCWLGHKQVLSFGFCEEEHFLVCEGDCRILDIDLFKLRLAEALQVLDDTDYPMIRFEEPFNGVNTQFFNQVSPNIWECDTVNCTHCYLVNKKSKEFFTNLFSTVGWHTPDWWYGFAFNSVPENMLCFKERLTTQFDGLSQIDNVVKTY